ncbi:MAG: glutaredoxin domain-containing protein [Oligoflexales bacterium]
MEVKLYTTDYCSYCVAAKRLLDQLSIPFQEVRLDNDPETRERLSRENNGYRTVPMIFIDDKFIGGYTELAALHRNNQLKKPN